MSVFVVDENNNLYINTEYLTDWTVLFFYADGGQFVKFADGTQGIEVQAFIDWLESIGDEIKDKDVIVEKLKEILEKHRAGLLEEVASDA